MNCPADIKYMFNSVHILFSKLRAYATTKANILPASSRKEEAEGITQYS
jgi:hypothetical protein